MAVEENYVRLEPHKPVIMRFDAFGWQPRKITDPDLGFTKTVKALVFHVIELNGEPADTVFSIISTKAQKEFEPYLEHDRFKNFRFQVVKEAPGFAPPRIMAVTPIA